MTPVKNFRSLEKRTKKSLRRFTKEAHALHTVSDRYLREKKASYIIINMQSCWANFIRAYYLSCMQNAYLPGHGKIQHNKANGNRNHAIGLAVKLVRSNATPKSNGTWDVRDEPTWHDTRTLIKAATDFAFSNAGDISSSFSAGSTVFKYMPTIRNYFAHRNLDTLQKARNVATNFAIRNNQPPSDILLSFPPGRSACLLQDWLAEMVATVELLCGA